VTYLGGKELFGPILAGEIQPTKVLSTTGMLPQVTQSLARFLGPKGLFPTARRGGVGDGLELVRRIREAKGSLDWQADRMGAVTASIARVPWTPKTVEGNIRAMISSVREAADSSSGPTELGDLVSKKSKKDAPNIFWGRLETTMGPSIVLNDL